MTTTIDTNAPAYLDNGVITDGEAWVPLQTHVESGSTTHTVTLQSSTGVNNWAQYQDLILIIDARFLYSSATIYPYMYFNNDTTDANYERQAVRNDSSTGILAYMQSNPGVCFFPGASATANAFGTAYVRIFDINSGKKKMLQCFNNHTGSTTASGINLSCVIWDGEHGTNAINRIDHYSTNSSYYWAPNSRWDVFGVLPRMVS